MKTNKIPDFKIVRYSLNQKEGGYTKIHTRVIFNKMPDWLKVEETREQRIRDNGAIEIITGRIKNSSREFFSGLIPIANNWFWGNDYEFKKGKKVNSLCIFNFSEDNNQLNVYYFNNWYKESRKERIIFCKDFIEYLLSHE